MEEGGIRFSWRWFLELPALATGWIVLDVVAQELLGVTLLYNVVHYSTLVATLFVSSFTKLRAVALSRPTAPKSFLIAMWIVFGLAAVLGLLVIAASPIGQTP